MSNQSRRASMHRKTNETDIQLDLMLDGRGENDIRTGIGFFDHMLTQVSRHGFLDIRLYIEGDLAIDGHHTVEDAGITLGSALREALGDKKGIRRYGCATVPMDESLVMCVLDLSGRAFLHMDATFTTAAIGGLDTEMIEEFFRAVSDHAGMNLHFKLWHGKNNHHIAEAMFKAFGRALDEAVALDPRISGVLSSKGMLE